MLKNKGWDLANTEHCTGLKPAFVFQHPLIFCNCKSTGLTPFLSFQTLAIHNCYFRFQPLLRRVILVHGIGNVKVSVYRSIFFLYKALQASSTYVMISRNFPFSASFLMILNNISTHFCMGVWFIRSICKHFVGCPEKQKQKKKECIVLLFKI